MDKLTMNVKLYENLQTIEKFACSYCKHNEDYKTKNRCYRGEKMNYTNCGVKELD